MGPGWYGHAMIPLEHAFDRDAATTGDAGTNACGLARKPRDISEELRRIPTKADRFSVNSIAPYGTATCAWRSVMRRTTTSRRSCCGRSAMPDAARKTRSNARWAICSETVVSAILEDAQQLAALAVDVLDRNLYERANDCRWWALNATLIGHVDANGARERQQISGDTATHQQSLHRLSRHRAVRCRAPRFVPYRTRLTASRVGQVDQRNLGTRDTGVARLARVRRLRVRPRALCTTTSTRWFSVRACAAAAAAPWAASASCSTRKPQFTAMLRDALPRTESGEVARWRVRVVRRRRHARRRDDWRARRWASPPICRVELLSENAAAE